MEAETQRDLFSDKYQDYELAKRCLGEEWGKLMWKEFRKSYMKKLSSFLGKERKNHIIRPKGPDIFRAFRLTTPDNITTVMVAQDPYPHQAADGLAFSSRTGTIPSSLARIYNEIEKDLGKTKRSPDLEHWASQGVLLLNKALTVRDGEPGSHHNVGWEKFITEVIHKMNSGSEKAFIFFGSQAQEFAKYVDDDTHLLIKASHPARPNSYAMNLKDKGYFKLINDFLLENYETSVEW